MKALKFGNIVLIDFSPRSIEDIFQIAIDIEERNRLIQTFRGLLRFSGTLISKNHQCPHSEAFPGNESDIEKHETKGKFLPRE